MFSSNIIQATRSKSSSSPSTIPEMKGPPLSLADDVKTMVIDPNDQLLSRDDIGRKHLGSDNVVITPRELSLHL